jgi:FUS-interacting serine-arginine-rich protein 1
VKDVKIKKYLKKKVYIPRDYYTKNPRGFAYVQFIKEEDAEAAMKELNGVSMLGKKNKFNTKGRALEITFATGERKITSGVGGRRWRKYFTN